MDKEKLELAKGKILSKIQNEEEWTYPYCFAEIKEEFSDLPEGLLDDIYATELKAKVYSLPLNELKKVMEEQNSLTAANKNFYLAELVQERISLN